MENLHAIIDLILKAIAVAMSVAVVVLSSLGQTAVGTLVTLLAIGLFALAVLSFRKDSTGEAS